MSDGALLTKARDIMKGAASGNGPGTSKIGLGHSSAAFCETLSEIRGTNVTHWRNRAPL